MKKNIGKPCTGKPYARFDEGGQANVTMVQLVRHRQTKEAVTDRLQPKGDGNLLSTLPDFPTQHPEFTSKIGGFLLTAIEQSQGFKLELVGEGLSFCHRTLLWAVCA